MIKYNNKIKNYTQIDINLLKVAERLKILKNVQYIDT